MSSESTWTRRVDTAFKLIGGFIVPISGGYYGLNGVADRYYAYRSTSSTTSSNCATSSAITYDAWIEFKGDETRLSALQCNWLRELARVKPLGCFVLKSCGCDARLFQGYNLRNDDLGLLKTEYIELPNLGSNCSQSVINKNVWRLRDFLTSRPVDQ